jgi:ribose 5-phosphate isomerase B
MEEKMNIWIASDHAGYLMKKDIVDYLSRNHLSWRISDMGPEDDNPVDYPIYAHKVADGVSRGECRRGILICGTGLGMSMMANRFLGVRAALCLSVEMAALSREHNRANILCLSGRKVTLEENIAIINKWLETEFTQDHRHVRRIELMDSLKSR